MKSATVLRFVLAMFFRSYFLSLLVLWKPSDLDVHQWHPNLQKRVASFHVCTFYHVIDYLILFSFSGRNFEDESRIFLKQSILEFKCPLHWISQRLDSNDQTLNPILKKSKQLFWHLFVYFCLVHSIFGNFFFFIFLSLYFRDFLYDVFRFVPFPFFSKISILPHLALKNANFKKK